LFSRLTAAGYRAAAGKQQHRKAEQSDVVPVAKFVAFLRQDFDAVTADLTLQWSSGSSRGT
jgi:transposase